MIPQIHSLKGFQPVKMKGKSTFGWKEQAKTMFSVIFLIAKGPSSKIDIKSVCTLSGQLVAVSALMWLYTHCGYPSPKPFYHPKLKLYLLNNTFPIPPPLGNCHSTFHRYGFDCPRDLI